jgi:septal ring factor EnvC (AmiA/AmiB activator)
MPSHQRGELILTASFQLFSTITKCTCSFSNSKFRKKLAIA